MGAAARPRVGQDWTPHGGSQPGEVEAEIVFAGRGEDSGRGRAPARSPSSSTAAPPPREAHRRASCWRRRGDHRRRGPASLEATSSHGGDAVGRAHAGRGGRRARAHRLEPRRARAGRRDAVGPHGRGLRHRVRLRLTIRLEAADRRADNVIGILPGTDPARRDGRRRSARTTAPPRPYRRRRLSRRRRQCFGHRLALGLARAFAAAVVCSPRTPIFALFRAKEVGLLGSGPLRAPSADRSSARSPWSTSTGRMRHGRVSVQRGGERGWAPRARHRRRRRREPDLDPP